MAFEALRMTHQMDLPRPAANFWGSLEDVHYKEQHIIHFLLLKKKIKKVGADNAARRGKRFWWVIGESGGQQKFCGADSINQASSASFLWKFWPLLLAPEFPNGQI